MPRKRTILFIIVLASLLVIPTVLPYLIGGVVLPAWSYLLYSFLVLINAGIYLADRLWLIDRYFVKGRIWAFIGWNLLLLLIASVLEFLVLDLSGKNILYDSVTVSEFLGISVNVSQKVLCVILGIIMVLASLAVALSDEWRLAAFRYREAASENARLGRDIDSLKGQVDALSRRVSAPDSISVKVDLMMTRVPLDDIDFVKAEGDYIVIYKSDGEKLMTLMTLKALEKQLPIDRFCRTHRSYIVAVDKVRGIQSGKLSVAGTLIPLSDSCKASFFELLSRRSIILRPE